MIFYVLTLFPDFFDGFLRSSIISRAIERKLIDVRIINIRDFALDKHKTCDDYTFGGGPGMVLKPEPLAGALDSIGANDKRVIYLTPSGNLLKQRLVEELSREDKLVLICGRYEGIDQRIIDTYVTDEISIGDYIITGGEIAAEVIIDATTRLVKGVINSVSLREESLVTGLLEYPHYTRPKVFRGIEVPEILRSGNHKKIEEWRLKKSISKTLKVRPDLLEIFKKNNKDNSINKIIAEIEREKGERRKE